MEKVRLGDVCVKASSNIAQKDLENNEGEFPIYGASGFIKNVNFYKQDKEYIAVVKDYVFESFKPQEYDYYISTGTVEEIRENFKAISDLV